jgi:hypothetical protein
MFFSERFVEKLHSLLIERLCVAIPTFSSIKACKVIEAGQGIGMCVTECFAAKPQALLK